MPSFEFKKIPSEQNSEVKTNGHETSFEPKDEVKPERKSREKNWESYGCFKTYPSSLEFLATGRFFLLFMCLLIFSDAFNIGTLGGALTSLETRYELRASQLGLIESLYEAGNLIFVLFIVHYAGKQDSRRPLWIGIGALTMAIGTAIAFSPQFFFSAYNPDWKSGLTNQTTEPLTCLSDWTADDPGFDQCEGEGQDNRMRENRLAYGIILFGEVLVGIGWTPVLPLALSYIDDNVNTKSSAMFIGVIQSMFGIGTIFGFLTSAAVAEKWVDFYRAEVDENKMTPENTLWVGAWWLGVAITSGLYFVSSLPFFGFPRRLPNAHKFDAGKNYFMLEKTGSRVDDPEADAQEEEKVVQNTASRKSCSSFALPASLWGLLSNPIYMFINISSFSEMAVIAGIVTFLPKYLETQFGLSPPQANFYMAVLPVPAVAIGSILGGYLVKKLNLNAEGATKLALGCSVIALVGQIALLGIGCDSAGIAGVDTPYFDSRIYGSSPTAANLVSACNVDCGCSSTDPEVVCGADGITYFSACYAGCKDSLNGSFFNCSCVQGPTTVDGMVYGSVQSGACPTECNMLAPFLAIMFLIALVSSSEEIPQTMVTMRCVKKSDKSLSLGLRHVFTRVLGNIPAPLYYGAAIDAACRLWQMFCGMRGECLAYSLPEFRFAYMGVTVALKTVSAFSYLVTLVLLRRQTSRVPRGMSKLEDGGSKQSGLEEAGGSKQNGLEEAGGSKQNGLEEDGRSKQNGLEEDGGSKQNGLEEDGGSKQNGLEEDGGSKQNGLEEDGGSKQNGLEEDGGSKQNGLEEDGGSKQNGLEEDGGIIKQNGLEEDGGSKQNGLEEYGGSKQNGLEEDGGSKQNGLEELNGCDPLEMLLTS